MNKLPIIFLISVSFVQLSCSKKNSAPKIQSHFEIQNDSTDCDINSSYYEHQVDLEMIKLNFSDEEKKYFRNYLKGFKIKEKCNFDEETFVKILQTDK